MRPNKTFPWYGWFSIFIILSVELNFILKIEPLASWYFPIIWFAFIFLLDASVLYRTGRSLAKSEPFKLFGMFILSVFFWYLFEIFNFSLQNWSYTGTESHYVFLGVISFFGILSYSTVLPAFFEILELFLSFKIFERFHLKKPLLISKNFLFTSIFLGLIFILLHTLFPTYTFPLVWTSVYLILDPINYIRKQPSVLEHFANGKLELPFTLLFTGLILGFFWEFWNYFAVIKWTYHLPVLNEPKIFEMPLVGYLGYLPFSFELYTLYWFVRGLLSRK